MRTNLLVLTLVLAALTAGAEELTPRQALDRAEKQFAGGGSFSADGELALADLERRLEADGDDDLSADLRLLRKAAAVQAGLAEGRDQAVARKDEDQAAWNLRERNEQNRGLWRTVRDGGLIVFTASTLTLVGLATVVEIDDNRLKNSTFSDWQSRQDWLNRARWGVAWAAGVSLISLFPLLWGEAKQ